MRDEEWKFPEERERSIERFRKAIDDGKSTYEISNYGIKCVGCLRTSPNDQDIRQRFCVCAEAWHVEIPRLMAATPPARGPIGRILERLGVL